MVVIFYTHNLCLCLPPQGMEPRFLRLAACSFVTDRHIHAPSGVAVRECFAGGSVTRRSGAAVQCHVSSMWPSPDCPLHNRNHAVIWLMTCYRPQGTCSCCTGQRFVTHCLPTGTCARCYCLFQRLAEWLIDWMTLTQIAVFWDVTQCSLVDN